MTTFDVRPTEQTAPERTTAQLLLEWDKRRARSQQRDLGMSEIGGCRRRVGYRLAGIEPTSASGSVQAVLGTAIHAAVEGVFKEMQAAGLIPADDLVEHEVLFAGVRGHFDRYEAARARLWDTKSTSDRWLEHIKIHGPDQQHLWQAHLYGAALISEGHPVRDVVVDYIARDTGRDHQVVTRFDPQHVRDALEWLRNVRETPLEMLNRDYAPDGPFCGHCPFRDTCWDGAVPDRDPRSVLYVEDPDAARWAQQLWHARAAVKAAKELEDEAKGALDALRPNVTGKSDPLDVGFDVNLQWSISTTTRLDGDAVRAEYARTGAKPPVKTSETTTLKFVAKPKEGKK